MPLDPHCLCLGIGRGLGARLRLTHAHHIAEGRQVESGEGDY